MYEDMSRALGAVVRLTGTERRKEMPIKYGQAIKVQVVSRIFLFASIRAKRAILWKGSLGLGTAGGALDVKQSAHALFVGSSRPRDVAGAPNARCKCVERSLVDELNFRKFLTFVCFSPHDSDREANMQHPLWHFSPCPRVGVYCTVCLVWFRMHYKLKVQKRHSVFGGARVCECIIWQQFGGFRLWTVSVSSLGSSALSATTPFSTQLRHRRQSEIRERWKNVRVERHSHCRRTCHFLGWRDHKQTCMCVCIVCAMVQPSTECDICRVHEFMCYTNFGAVDQWSDGQTASPNKRENGFWPTNGRQAKGKIESRMCRMKQLERVCDGVCGWVWLGINVKKTERENEKKSKIESECEDTKRPLVRYTYG